MGFSDRRFPHFGSCLDIGRANKRMTDAGKVYRRGEVQVGSGDSFTLPHSPGRPSGHKRAESRCRYYTREEAKRVGWDVRHPGRGGQFLEEQELVDYFPALKAKLGLERPDFGIVTGAGTLQAIVECKSDYKLLDQAVTDACGYADTISEVPNFDLRVAVGVAGSPDKSAQTRTLFRKGAKWVPLTSHGYALTQIPTPLELSVALANNDGTTDVQLPTEKEFFDAAIAISRILRLAKVEEPQRPKVVGAIILALYQGDFSLDPAVVLGHINSNVRAAIQSCQDVPPKRRELLIQTLTLSLESSQLRTAIPDIVHQLERLNVRSIMRSGVDFLGQFYEAFLRYGCDSKGMGIVFTPRHVTRFCADLTDTKLGMSVYDPACGTGGFLVAAYDRMMKDANTPKATKQVKESLYGSDTNVTVWALSILNMMFRGDGKSHIDFTSCFKDEGRFAEMFDRVLLNPPFSQEGEPETDFIDHSLRSLKPGGVIAAVLKTSIMVDDEHVHWRRALVSGHHVLGVISLPPDLFYPTGSPTVILAVRAHSPDKSLGTFLARVENDGFQISKNRRIPIQGSQLPQILSLFREFMQTRSVETIPNVACVVSRNQIDQGQEICAEQWLPSASMTLKDFEKMYHEAIKQMSLAVANYPEVIDELIDSYEDELTSGETKAKPTWRAALRVWFEIASGRSSGLSNYPAGEIPFISSGDTYNGIVGFAQPAEREIYGSPHISVTGFGRAYVQPWRFCARGNGGSAVRILKPRFAMNLSQLFWLIGQINAQRWRFHYGRMAIKSRLQRLEIDPPPSKLPTMPRLAERLRDFRSNLEALFK